MRLYYVDAEQPRHYVRTALGIDAERWNDLRQHVRDWRFEIRDRHDASTDRKLQNMRALVLALARRWTGVGYSVEVVPGSSSDR